MIDGFPISEIAVDNFLLFPPEYCFTGLSDQSVRASRLIKQSTIYKILCLCCSETNILRFTNGIFFLLIPYNRA